MISRFDKSKIRPDLMGIVVMSHGPLADSILESAAVITGCEVENSAAFCLEANDNPEEYGSVISEAVNAFSGGCLIFLDLLGGTPSNQLIIHAKKNKKEILAVTGVSLPMIISAITLREDGLQEDDLLHQIIEESIAGIVNVKARMENMRK